MNDRSHREETNQFFLISLNFKWPFSLSHNRLATGGWARQQNSEHPLMKYLYGVIGFIILILSQSTNCLSRPKLLVGLTAVLHYVRFPDHTAQGLTCA
jgi:hypothetical protein